MNEIMSNTHSGAEDFETPLQNQRRNLVPIVGDMPLIHQQVILRAARNIKRRQSRSKSKKGMNILPDLYNE
jgi:CMP-2-keto-3-deoxyoctulosonic acid synthetase